MIINNGTIVFKIPVGRLMVILENVLNNRMNISNNDGKSVFMTYDYSDDKMYVEERYGCFESEIVSRYQCKYKLDQYIKLYKSTIEVIKYMQTYYPEYSIFGVSFDKSEITVENIVDNKVEIYAAQNTDEIFDMINRVHPYFLNNIEECITRKLTDKEVSEICKEKLDRFISLI